MVEVFRLAYFHGKLINVSRISRVLHVSIIRVLNRTITTYLTCIFALHKIACNNNYDSLIIVTLEGKHIWK